MAPDRTQDLAAFLPLSAVSFEILIALADQERHGYAILRSVEERTGTGLHAGTLYRTLARLESAGLVEALDERPDPGDDERRRYYRLTSLGRRVAGAEARRLEGQVGAARALGLLVGG